MHPAKFISIEGVEGAGKSTVMKFVSQFLQQAGKEVTLTREPGGTLLAEKMRQILLHPDVNETIVPETELLLMFAGRAQHLQHCILPALASGKWVVSDRFVDASYAYQGGGRKINLELITALDKHIVGKHYPDMTLLLDVSPEIGFMRTANRSAGKDRIEKERIDFFERVRAMYLERADKDPARIKIINAALTQAEVENQVADALSILIKRTVT